MPSLTRLNVLIILLEYIDLFQSEWQHEANIWEGYNISEVAKVYSNSGSLKQGVWGTTPQKLLGCLISELPKIQDFDYISQIIKG